MSELILIVEDDRDIADLLIAYARRAGFRTSWAANVGDAVQLHAQMRPALVMLDIGLPDGDGIDVLTAIRRRDDTPIIMITAVDDDVTKLMSFRVGADDYVMKPFNPSEVIERARAVLRRVQGATRARTLVAGDLSIDLDARLAEVRTDDGSQPLPLALTPTEFQILAHMARQPRRAFSRAELLEAAAPESEALDRVIDSHISKLRIKLSAAGLVGMIQPVRSVGYRLAPNS
ncbi:response regulator [Sphingomonas mucosissima]|uniref:Transcriptional regulatory protein SrrA n=1 Tax=Sphingomonas mucosissima TaxID=370959 RepID=A0A245ZFH6_9SPHN|nr:response regulator [Sphingomonas mucosissima]OWK28479.1 transcriptional regulatory protein SrrA [Sphingomonas mucosissima]